MATISVVECQHTQGRNHALHPRSNGARFLPRLGYNQQALIPIIAAHGIRTVVVPLHHLRDNRQLSLLVEDRLGRVLDPCTHLRQLPWAERAPRFRELAFGNDRTPYDPECSRLTDSDMLALALGPLDAQRGRGATLLLSTYHLAGSCGTRGREVELELAGLAVKHFRQQRMDEAPPLVAHGTRREVYATIAVRLADLDSVQARRELAGAYLALGADGIWVKIAGFNERASLDGIRAASSFIGELREGGIPIVSCGAGQLHLALLANEISASLGIAEAERFAAPVVRRRAADVGGRVGRARFAYNARLHRSFKVGSPQAASAFAVTGCDCGEHESHEPPNGSTVTRHAAALRARQAERALSGACGQRRRRLLAASAVAASTAAKAGLPGATVLLPRYRAVFEGLDAADAGKWSVWVEAR